MINKFSRENIQRESSINRHLKVKNYLSDLDIIKHHSNKILNQNLS